MSEFAKPVVIISQCLGFANCRYNGEIIRDEFVEKLRPHVEFRPVCPEVEIGLGVPREPIRVVAVSGELRLLQPATGRDITERMRDFAASFLASLQEVDGFILKSRSPSCGIHDVPIYASTEGVESTTVDSGLFARAVRERFPDLPIEDERRLEDDGIKREFLTRLFAKRGAIACHERHLCKMN